MENIEILAKNALDSLRDYNNALIDCYCDAKPHDNCFLEILTDRLDTIHKICGMLDTSNPFENVLHSNNY